MRSGRKNCRVKIFELVMTRDAETNAPVHTPRLKYFPYADAHARRGREIEIEGQITYESYMRFDFDYLDVKDLSPTDYIEYEGVQYEIAGLLPDLSTKESFIVDAVARPRGTGRA